MVKVTVWYYTSDTCMVMIYDYTNCYNVGWWKYIYHIHVSFVIMNECKFYLILYIRSYNILGKQNKSWLSNMVSCAFMNYLLYYFNNIGLKYKGRCSHIHCWDCLLVDLLCWIGCILSSSFNYKICVCEGIFKFFHND
jgi:hypothetical protein